jgi:hypothetical protein
MKIVNNIIRRKLVIVVLLAFATQISIASFTGTIGESSKNKYSLKSFNKNFYKKASPYSLRAGFQYKGTQIMSQQKDATGTTFNNMMRFEQGNTTYIYPYKHKVRVATFKTPAPSSIQ